MSVDSRRPSKAEEEPSKAEEDSNEVEPTGDFVLGNELRSSHKKNSWDVKAVLQNDSDQSIGLRWVDYSGNVKNATIVDPGDTWSMKYFNTWAWSIIEPESTKEITRVYFIDDKIPVSCKNLLSRVPEVEEEFDFEVASKAKSTYNKASSWKVHPAIKNDTDDDVLIKWIDYKGEAVRPHVCASGNRWGQSCYNTHPWSICNPETEQEITRVRFVKNGTVLLSQIFKAQGSSSKAHKLAEEQIHNPIADDAADEEDELTMVTGEDDSVVKCPSEELGSVYHKHQLEGFRVWLEEGVVEKNPNLIPRLTLDLREFNRVYPPDAVAMLQEKSGFWINHSRHFSDEKNPRSGMVTHWSRGWLRDKGDVQDKCGFVESYKASSYAVEFGIFKAVITHELSHAYHMWTRGKNDTMIKETYKKAIGEGLYDNGEYCGNPIKEGTWWTGKLNRRPYAAKNHHEYFAEACTSFFSSNRFRNGFYPYVHCELKNFDPHAYKMIEEAFGISGEDQVTRGEVPEDWLRKFAKIDFYAAREAVRAADVDGSGKLDFDEFASCIESLGVEGITNEEAAGLATFADANKDGVVDPEEVFTWLANHMGKKDETKEEA